MNRRKFIKSASALAVTMLMPTTTIDTLGHLKHPFNNNPVTVEFTEWKDTYMDPKLQEAIRIAAQRLADKIDEHIGYKIVNGTWPWE